MNSDRDQLGIGFGAAPFAKGSDTSEDAAEQIAPVAGTLCWYVLECVRSRLSYGATRDEVAQAMEMRLQTVCARMRELVVKGYVVDSGRRRKTTSGRMAAVMVAREPGR